MSKYYNIYSYEHSPVSTELLWATGACEETSRVPVSSIIS